MVAIWTFMDFIEISGRNPTAEWLDGFNDEVQAAISARLLLMEGMLRWPEKWASKYRGWDELHEIRIPFKKVQYRPLYIYDAGRKVILLNGSIERDGKIPRADLEAANRRRKDYRADPSCAVPHQY
jgi:hypothetical protein